MASLSNQVGKFERMMVIVEQMMRSRDNDANVEKSIHRSLRSRVNSMGGTNVTKFLDAYKREMN